MRIAISDHHGKIASTWDRPAMTCDRDAVGPGEEFALLSQVGDAWLPLDLETLIRRIVAEMLPAQPIVPQPPSIAPWAGFPGSAQEWFSQLVYGKPFGQETLLALEPTLNANSWQLTPPNAAGDRTKVAYRLDNGLLQWVRVGFGEGAWVWVVQP